MTDYDSLIRSVMALEPPLFIFGGFAEDMLLNGRVARPHSDLDVLMFRDEVDARLAQFTALGFANWEVWWEPRPGLPLVYHSAKDGLDLEPSVFERDETGAYFVIENASGKLHRAYLPDGTFGYPPIAADGLEFRIVSPLCLYQIRAALEILAPFGPLREKDIAAQGLLRDRFLADLTDEELRPRITPL